MLSLPVFNYPCMKPLFFLILIIAFTHQLRAQSGSSSDALTQPNKQLRLSQSNINRTNEYGQKIGKWISYYPNGKIKEVQLWQDEEIPMEDAYYYQAKDTTEYYHYFIWTEQYEYDDEWKLSRIKRTEKDADPIFIYGPNKDVSVRSSDFFLIGRVNDSKQVSVELKNNSKNSIALVPKFSSKDCSGKKQILNLAPHQTTTFAFKVNLQPNENQYQVELKNEHIKIGISVKTFGYHVLTGDIKTGHELKVEKNFTYHRTGEEALLKIYKKDKELQTISLAKKNTDINLQKLKPGEYLICTINYSDDYKSCCKVEVSK